MLLFLRFLHGEIYGVVKILFVWRENPKASVNVSLETWASPQWVKNQTCSLPPDPVSPLSQLLSSVVALPVLAPTLLV